MDPCPTLSPLQQQILAHHLRAEILQLVVHFQNCGGILPIPNADLALAWAFLPNQNVHSTRSTGDVQNVKTDVSTHNGPDAAEATSAAGPPGGNGAVHIDSWVSFKQPSMPPSEVNRPPTTVPRPKSAPSAQTARVSSANAASSSRTSTPVSSSDTQSPATSTDDTSSSRDRKQVVLTADLLLSRGNIQLVDTLLKLGTTDCRSATPVATIIKSIQTKLRNNLPRKKYIKSRLQIKAMAMFHDHWKADGHWTIGSKQSLDNAHTSIKGVNIAGFLGALFTVGAVTPDDIHLCLDLLINGPVHFDRLCAMHALIVQANDKLCMAQSALSLIQFRQRLSVRSLQTGKFAWGEDGPSSFLITDIMRTLDRWFAGHTRQQAKNARCRSRRRRSI